MEPHDTRGVRTERFRQALASLHFILAVEGVPAEILRDALIQRFEFTFEALWKLLQSMARDQGLVADSPRQALQMALRLGLLAAEDEEDAWALLRWRNLTVHTYDESTAREVEAFVRTRATAMFDRIADRTA